jgi:hypothetical protein
MRPWRRVPPPARTLQRERSAEGFAPVRETAKPTALFVGTAYAVVGGSLWEADIQDARLGDGPTRPDRGCLATAVAMVCKNKTCVILGEVQRVLRPARIAPHASEDVSSAALLNLTIRR